LAWGHNMTNNNRSLANATYIAQGDVIEGNLKISGVLVVDGELCGQISCGCLVVGKTGRVNGVISVAEAEIYGKIGYQMNVDKILTVYGSGCVEGLWKFNDVIVEKGGSVNGNCVSNRIIIKDINI